MGCRATPTVPTKRSRATPLTDGSSRRTTRGECRGERREVGGTHVGGREGELLEEAEGRAQLRVERRRAPVRQHGRDQPVVLQGQRRDRAVTLCSEHALVEA